jgi:hypothetical protein
MANDVTLSGVVNEGFIHPLSWNTQIEFQTPQQGYNWVVAAPNRWFSELIQQGIAKLSQAEVDAILATPLDTD